ncbi:alpha/beta fold hydrolase [Streptomyces sp. NBC_00047]|uniref:thioesterase II family protein n=1 Tax=Streptomyces sp. NBC_00047 TaxID=2975627 RepID=UPI002250DFFB|nr:alpha/beta fold hydrolase [Streptomyces sp. NBC_00047]MCX5611358.1 alpha/beta fold hydrolase [Streptomyces sp. NBC_00047]
MASPIGHGLAGRPSLVAITRRPAAALRLVCLPPAGLGPAFYRTWAEHLPETVDLFAVQLPGRGALAEQLCLTDPHEVADGLAEVIHEVDDRRPFALFGHCVGALLAYATTRVLRGRQHRGPLLLALSAWPAPHLDVPIAQLARVMLAGRARLADLYGPIPEELLADPRAMATAYTPFLADLLMALQYRQYDEPPLDLPLSVYGARDDAVFPPEFLRTWSDLSAQPVTPRIFPGSHAYPRDQARELTDRLGKDLVAARRYAAQP